MGSGDLFNNASLHRYAEMQAHDLGSDPLWVRWTSFFDREGAVGGNLKTLLTKGSTPDVVAFRQLNWLKFTRRYNNGSAETDE